MNILIAGASGLIGGALVSHLRAAGHEVWRLVRRAAQKPDEIVWNPAAGTLDSSRSFDAVINLAGENVGSGRWTAARRDRILRSRIDSTRTLVRAMARLARKPEVFVSASATGYYGERGNDTVTEASASGQGFLPDVCRAWEAEAVQATELGVRAAIVRFGLVLTGEGGVLGKMLPLFRAGLGGRLGSGKQWMSWISREDLLEIVSFLLADARCAGPINVVAPGAVTNAEFTAALGRALHRPAILPAPAWALRLAFGQMADEALLGSTRVAPQRLSEWGYRFKHPALDAALQAEL